MSMSEMSKSQATTWKNLWDLPKEFLIYRSTGHRARRRAPGCCGDRGAGATGHPEIWYSDLFVCVVCWQFLLVVFCSFCIFLCFLVQNRFCFLFLKMNHNLVTDILVYSVDLGWNLFCYRIQIATAPPHWMRVAWAAARMPPMRHHGSPGVKHTAGETRDSKT